MDLEWVRAGGPDQADARHDRASSRRVPAGRTSSSGTAYGRSLQVAGGARRLCARSGAEITAAYPELAALAAAGPRRACSTARWCVLDDSGQPVVHRCWPSGCTSARQTRAAQLAATPAGHVHDLRRAAARRRRPDRPARTASAGTPLEELGLGGSRWAVPPIVHRRRGHAGGRGGAPAWRAWSPSGSTSIYRPGLRSPDWVKVKLESTGEFVVGGWRPGVAQDRRAAGRRARPGRPAASSAAGSAAGSARAVGARAARACSSRCAGRARSPFEPQAVPREDARGAIWVRPEIVVEVKYGQRTPDGRLRFPRFLRLRPDLTRRT